MQELQLIQICKVSWPSYLMAVADLGYRVRVFENNLSTHGQAGGSRVSGIGYRVRVFGNSLSMNGEVGGSRILGKGFREQFKHEGQVGGSRQPGKSRAAVRPNDLDYRNQTKVKRPFDSLRGIAAPFPNLAADGRAVPEFRTNMIPYHATHGDLSIDRSEGPPLNKFLKVMLLHASTEEVYFVPPGGHIDRNPEQ
ncbi:hypothetical protein H5410_008564 [Solanum commersonii]|uniref:Uncharacterized protein n=1 Tax=Solanum commersonii TaxID=4109 RepID=A0A9J6AGZ6_SOLCO|nr:hypothetical protein H5410_008564 [Solanum commersonii]